MLTPAEPVQVWVRVMGVVDIEVDGQPVPLSPLQRLLIADLAVHAGRPVAIDRLIFSLWGDDAPRSSSNRIQALISDIRRRLVAVGAPAHLIETTPPGYRLRTDVATLDSAEFIRLVQIGRQHSGRHSHEAAVSTFDSALSLWRGPAFDAAAALLDPELPAAAARLDESRVQVVEERVQAQLALGHNAIMIPELSALVEAHPLRERLRSQLMLALHRSGRTADALATYRAGHTLSIDELGTEPGEALRQLHKAILNGEIAGTPSEPTPDKPVLPADTTSAERGRTASERDRPAPAQLPAGPNPFVGRIAQRRELDEIREAGVNPAPAIVISTVEGAGGVGKTALAVHWARGVADHFPDGQLYLNLQGYSDNAALRPVEALARLLIGLGVPAPSIPADEDAAVALYQTRLSGKRMLLLLDNAGHPDQVRSLLPAQPGCLALITTRERFTGLIASHGARRIVVNVLAPAEAVALLAQIVGAQRISDDEAAAYELAAACSYLPLALRIVAANLLDSPGRSLGELVTELRGERGLDAMHVDGDPLMSVRAVIAQSFGRLDSAARRTLALLGLAPGPDTTLAAVAALTDLVFPQDVLDVLVNAHLLQHKDGRYSLHDVVRSFAREQCKSHLSTVERGEALDRIFAFYLGRIEAAAAVLYPQVLRLPPLTEAVAFTEPLPDVDEAMAWLEAERANLVAVVRYAASHAPARFAWHIAQCLSGYFWIRRHMADWLLVGRLGLETAQAAGDERGQIICHITLGQARRAVGQYPRAAEHFDAATALATSAGWPEAEARAANNRAIVFAEVGKLAQAAAGMAQSLAIDRRIGRVAGEAPGLLNLATLHMRMGEFRAALVETRSARTLYRDVQAPGGEAMAVSNLGLICRELGLLTEAAEYADAAVEMTTRLDDYGRANAYSCRALVRMDQRRFDDARADLEYSLELTRQAGDPKFEGHHLIAKADLLREMGDVVAAREALRQGRQRFEPIDDDFGHAEALVSLARLDAVSADPVTALASAVAAVEHANLRGYRLLRAQARLAGAYALAAAGDRSAARQWGTRALGGSRSVGARLGVARALRFICLLDPDPSVRTRCDAEAARLEADMGLSAGQNASP